MRLQVVRAERARVGVEYVLGVGGFDLERVEEEVRPLSLVSWRAVLWQPSCW